MLLQATGSKANIDNINVTTHHGAGNIYVSGTGSVLNVSYAWLYSSGPAANSITSSNNATVIASNVRSFTGGVRSNVFAGSNHGGHLSVTQSFAHTQGVGSACFYALGDIQADGVLCETDQAPMLFLDGA